MYYRLLHRRYLGTSVPYTVNFLCVTLTVSTKFFMYTYLTFIQTDGLHVSLFIRIYLHEVYVHVNIVSSLTSLSGNTRTDTTKS